MTQWRDTILCYNDVMVCHILWRSNVSCKDEVMLWHAIICHITLTWLCAVPLFPIFWKIQSWRAWKFVCLRGVDFTPLSTMFLFNLGTVPTVWYILFFYSILELFRQCGIFCLSFYLYCSRTCYVSAVFFNICTAMLHQNSCLARKSHYLSKLYLYTSLLGQICIYHV